MVPMLAAGVVALALLGSGMLVFSTESTRPTTAVVAVATVANAPRDLQAAASSLVMLHLSDAEGSRVADGLVLNGGGLIVTTAPLTSTTTVTVITDTQQRLSASVVATDARSGLGILRPASVLADPASMGEVNPTSTALAISLSDARFTQLRWVHTIVSSTDVPVVVDHIALGAVRTVTPLDVTPGSLLVSPGGRLEAVATPRLGPHLYLPASVITRLAEQLAQGAAPMHYVLGILARTNPDNGITVVAVDPAGPSAGLLFAGDVITAIEGTRVQTASELVDALYVHDSSAAEHLTVRRAGHELEVVVDPVPTT